MTWTTARTWVTGEVVTAAEMNEQLRDNQNYLHHGRPGATIYGNSQAISTSTDTTLNFTTVFHDNGGISIPGGGVLEPIEAGVYIITAGLFCAGSGQWTVKIYVGSTIYAAGEGQVIGASASVAVSLGSGSSYAITCHVNTTSGATMTTQGLLPFLSAYRIT